MGVSAEECSKPYWYLVLYVGLVQPIANWAKRDEPNRGGMPAYLGGWWIIVFPVAGTVRAHSSPTHGLPKPTTRVPLSASPYHTFTTLLTARIRYFSRSLLPSHPPWQIRIAPPLPHRETSVVTIFPGKGSDILSNASGSGTRHWTRWI